MTKKELMVKAHKMAREIKNEYPAVNYKFQLGLCLTYLHEEGDNDMVELKGSEKQVKWAKELKKTMIENIEMMESFESYLTKYARMTAEALGHSFPEVIRRDKENLELRKSIARKYLNQAKDIIENEVDSAKIINEREIKSIEEVIEILKDGRM